MPQIHYCWQNNHSLYSNIAPVIKLQNIYTKPATSMIIAIRNLMVFGTAKIAGDILHLHARFCCIFLFILALIKS